MKKYYALLLIMPFILNLACSEQEDNEPTALEGTWLVTGFQRTIADEYNTHKVVDLDVSAATESKFYFSADSAYFAQRVFLGGRQIEVLAKRTYELNGDSIEITGYDPFEDEWHGSHQVTWLSSNSLKVIKEYKIDYNRQDVIEIYYLEKSNNPILTVFNYENGCRDEFITRVGQGSGCTICGQTSFDKNDTLIYESFSVFSETETASKFSWEVLEGKATIMGSDSASVVKIFFEGDTENIIISSLVVSPQGLRCSESLEISPY